MEKTIADIIIKTVAYQSEEYKQILQLRNDVLRAPLGLTFSEDFLARDVDNILIGAFIGDEIIGCCQLEKAGKDTYQLRQMAVADKLQGGGIGSKIIQYAEKVAKQEEGTQITLHARQVAAGFYRKLGYTPVGDQFMELELPHIEMVKDL